MKEDSLPDIFAYIDGTMWFPLGSFTVTARELCLLLQYYDLDEIQLMIGSGTFSAKLYRAIRPYLVWRANNSIIH